VKKLVALFIGLVYLGLSNYCLTYAVITGESHHELNSAGQLERHGSDDHEHGAHDHHASHDHGEPADHDDGASDACCVKFNDSGVILPSTSQLLVKAALVVLPGFLNVALASVPVAPSASSYSRPDHGPPKLASQVPPSCRASRAPPVIA